MKEIKCLQCGRVTLKYDREGDRFCNRTCYMEWRRTQDLTRATSWKGGRIKMGRYWYLYKPNHPFAMHGKRYVAEHRLVMEGLLSRYLEPYEDVHHIDGDTNNNAPYNLELITHKRHAVESANNKRRDSYGKFTASQV